MRVALGLFAGFGILLILITVLFGEPVEDTNGRTALSDEITAPIVEPSPEPVVASMTVPLEVVGNIVRDNPGLDPDVWYLMYDEPGRAGRSVALTFASSSECAFSGTTTPCTTYVFEQGQRVRIVGTRTEDRIDVFRAEQVETVPQRATGSNALAE